MEPRQRCTRCGCELKESSPSGLCAACFKLLFPPEGEAAKPPGTNKTVRITPGTVSPVGAVPAVKNRQFGEYEILEGIAQGGMGVIYKARQSRTDRLVALKTILSGMLAGEDQLQRFRTEAEAVANLDHPNIIPIYEVGEHDNQLFFSMKLIETGSLEDQIEHYKADHKAAAKLIATVARAIHYAHQHGILHRDLKPDNILIDANGTPYVTDFGLAKRVGEQKQVTVTGEIIGTPNYMPPEQAEGKKHTPTTAVDVYGLGAILYKLLTGRPPFQADSPLETIRMVTEQEPQRPSTLNHRADRDLETICLKCMEKDPARRYGSAEAVAEDLERWLRDEPILARPSSAFTRTIKWIKRRPAVAALVWVVLTAIVFFIVLVLSNDNKLQHERDFAVQQESLARLAKTEAEKSARQAENNAKISLSRLVRSQVGNGIRLFDEGDASGSLLWISEALSLMKNDPAGEEAQRIRFGIVLRQCPRLVGFWTESADLSAATASPDGRLIATASRAGIVHIHDAISGELIGPALEHTGTVTRVTFSPDSRRLATISGDKSKDYFARVWDLHTGKLVIPPLPNTRPLNVATFSPDGSRLLTAGDDHSAHVWDLRTGKSTLPTLNHLGEIKYAAFSADGHFIVTTSQDHTAIVWDASTGLAVTPALIHKNTINYAAFSPDNRFVVTAGDDRAVRIWDVTSGQLKGTPLHLNGAVTHVEFSPDGHKFVTANTDNTARVWDVETGEPITPPLPHNTKVLYASFSPDGRRILSHSEKTSRIWDASSGQPLTPPLIQNAELLYAAFTHGGQDVILVSKDRVVKIWNVALSQPAHRTLEMEQGVQHVLFSPDKTQLLTVTEKSARVWDIATGNPLSPPLMESSDSTNQNSDILVARFSPDGKRVLMICRNQKFVAWDIQRGEALKLPPKSAGAPKQGRPFAKAPPALRQEVMKLDKTFNLGIFSADGSKLIEADYDRMATVSTVPRGPRIPLRGHTAAILHAAFSPDATRVITASADHTARIWDATQSKPALFILNHKDRVEHAEFSPDGRYVVTASWDNTARIWDANTGLPVGQPLEHSAEVRWATFSPNSHEVVTASADNTARVWDATTGEPITPFLQHNGWVIQATFSPDGGRVVTASGDNTARVWDAVTGEPISPFLQHKDLPNSSNQVNSAIFSPDGRLVISAGMDGTARVWNLPPDPRPLEDLQSLADLLSGRRIDPTGSLTPAKSKTLEDAWQHLRHAYPLDFKTTREQILAWHEQQADNCEEAKDWFAAAFHLDKLIEANPKDPELKKRRDAAQAEMEKIQPVP